MYKAKCKKARFAIVACDTPPWPYLQTYRILKIISQHLGVMARKNSNPKIHQVDITTKIPILPTHLIIQTYISTKHYSKGRSMENTRMSLQRNISSQHVWGFSSSVYFQFNGISIPAGLQKYAMVNSSVPNVYFLARALRIYIITLLFIKYV